MPCNTIFRARSRKTSFASDSRGHDDRRALATPHTSSQDGRGTPFPSGSRERGDGSLPRSREDSRRGFRESQYSARDVRDALLPLGELNTLGARRKDVRASDWDYLDVPPGYMEPNRRRPDVTVDPAFNDVPLQSRGSTVSSTIYIHSDPVFSGDKELSEMTSLGEPDSDWSHTPRLRPIPEQHETFDDVTDRYRLRRWSPTHGELWYDSARGVWRDENNTPVNVDLDMLYESSGASARGRDDVTPGAWARRQSPGNGTFIKQKGQGQSGDV